MSSACLYQKSYSLHDSQFDSLRETCEGSLSAARHGRLALGQCRWIQPMLRPIDLGTNKRPRTRSPNRKQKGSPRPRLVGCLAEAHQPLHNKGWCETTKGAGKAVASAAEVQRRSSVLWHDSSRRLGSFAVLRTTPDKKRGVQDSNVDRLLNAKLYQGHIACCALWRRARGRCEVQVQGFGVSIGAEIRGNSQGPPRPLN